MLSEFYRIVWSCVFGGLLAAAVPVIYANAPSGSGGAGSERDVLIGFNEFPGAADEALVRSHGGEVRRTFWLIPALLATIPEAAVAALERNPNVRYVEPDGMVHALDQEVPWGVDRVFGGESYAFSTWTASTGADVGVAVLDTGIDGEHADLPEIAGGTNTIDGTSWSSDGSGHGTHVAGTIAASDNTVGVVGVAPSVDLYAVKVLNDSGSGTISSVVSGIEWAVGQGIPIVNMSLGTSSNSQTLRDACDAAYYVDGLLLIAAAGNSGNPGGRGNNVNYPARYESVVAVGASTSNDSRASFSSTGPDVELIAPGQNILSTVPDNSYAYKSGTSMASPHVAGVAGLVWAANRDLTNEQVRSILRDTAEDLGLSSNQQGYGLVRADRAVESASGADSGGSSPEEPEEPEEPEPEEPAGDLDIVSFELTNVSNPNWARVRVDWHVRGATQVTSELRLDGVLVDSATTTVSGSDVEDSHTLRNRERQVKTYEVRLIITDGDGTKSKTESITM